ncbi:MAG: hypothetical protein AB7V58_06020 [Solirubrobacterales bacterium]
MSWPPQLGKVLPRAAEAWCEPSKWGGWILAPHGHGPEWETVLRVGLGDVDSIWGAIRAAVQSEPVSRIRDASRYGLICRVDVELTLGARTATIRTAWHYSDAHCPPRLVSAYPTL